MTRGARHGVGFGTLTRRFAPTSPTSRARCIGRSSAQQDEVAAADVALVKPSSRSARLAYAPGHRRAPTFSVALGKPGDQERVGDCQNCRAEKDTQQAKCEQTANDTG
jgi:hypothetical protein